MRSATACDDGSVSAESVSIEHVLVDPATGRNRLIAFEGTENFRDLGGHPTRFGVPVRWGTLYRSDGLQALTDGDVERYRALGVRVVYDLRRDSERVSRPNRVPSEAHCMMTPVDARGEVAADRLAAVDRDGGEAMLRAMYAQMVAYSLPVIAGVLTGMADAGRLPAVFHCHAGKDRTGFVAAMLLEAVGVPRDTVLDDYELTARYRRREHQEESFERLVAGGMPVEAALGIMGSPRWAMAETLEELDTAFGGTDRYLREQAGLDPEMLDRLRDRLVEP